MSQGTSVRALRVSAGLTQHEVAAAVRSHGNALTQTFLSQIENGEREVSTQIAEEISAAIVSILDQRRSKVSHLLTTAGTYAVL